MSSTVQTQRCSFHTQHIRKARTEETLFCVFFFFQTKCHVTLDVRFRTTFKDSLLTWRTVLLSISSTLSTAWLTRTPAVVTTSRAEGSSSGPTNIDSARRWDTSRPSSTKLPLRLVVRGVPVVSVSAKPTAGWIEDKINKHLWIQSETLPSFSCGEFMTECAWCLELPALDPVDWDRFALASAAFCSAPMIGRACSLRAITSSQRWLARTSSVSVRRSWSFEALTASLQRMRTCFCQTPELSLALTENLLCGSVALHQGSGKRHFIHPQVPCLIVKSISIELSLHSKNEKLKYKAKNVRKIATRNHHQVTSRKWNKDFFWP